MTSRLRSVGIGFAVSIALASAVVSAQKAPPSQLVVDSAVPDVQSQRLVIHGRNFGPSPFVTFDLMPLTLETPGDTLIVQAIGRLIASATGPRRLAPLLGLPLLVVFGSPFAFVIGGVVAFAFGAVEALLFGISERLSRWADGDAHGSDVPP